MPIRKQDKNMKSMPNISEAKDLVYSTYPVFNKYSPAYAVTNEDVRKSMKYIKKSYKTALTVAASGDHPLFCKLYGIEHVTTFDISYNAKVVMDLKTLALQHLTLNQYYEMQNSLWHNINVRHAAHTQDIISKLSSEVQQYIDGMNGYLLFDNGRFRSERYQKYALQQQEFSKLKQIVHEPFDFIWSDVKKLKLKQSYDFIHLSNICDFLPYVAIQKVLIKMLNHTNTGGSIVMLLHQKNDIYRVKDIVHDIQCDYPGTQNKNVVVLRMHELVKHLY